MPSGASSSAFCIAARSSTTCWRPRGSGDPHDGLWLDPIELKRACVADYQPCDFLAEGFTLRDSCRKAFAQHQLPMTLYPRLSTDMNVDGGPQADDPQPRLESAGQFALANQP